MKLANIYPVKNQDLYKDEEYVMILAHLLDKYDPSNFSKDQFIILDNGLFEGAQVSSNLRDIVALAESSVIDINEIVIPDTLFDKVDTIKKFESALDCIREYSSKYSFMFVAQSKNLDELKQNVEYINQYEDLNLTLGIPKTAPYDRTSIEAIEIYKKSVFPIHFLGAEDYRSIKYLVGVSNLVRSCDTSQICIMLKNNIVPEMITDYYRNMTFNTKTIDLENDDIDKDNIIKARTILKKFEETMLTKTTTEYNRKW